jgi:hypothetical protein
VTKYLSTPSRMRFHPTEFQMFVVGTVLLDIPYWMSLPVTGYILVLLGLCQKLGSHTNIMPIHSALGSIPSAIFTTGTSRLKMSRSVSAVCMNCTECLQWNALILSDSRELKTGDIV